MAAMTSRCLASTADGRASESSEAGISNLKGDTAPLSSENKGEAGPCEATASSMALDLVGVVGLTGDDGATTRRFRSLESSARASAKSLFATTSAASNRSVSGFLASFSSSSCFRKSLSTDASRYPSGSSARAASTSLLLLLSKSPYLADASLRSVSSAIRSSAVSWANRERSFCAFSSAPSICSDLCASCVTSRRVAARNSSSALAPSL
mmetsp:Transcript_16714/g.48840  ORF Transcript_16714/g.48840 Transcript_16714/m.48840 type:complete len:210 (-) Transcript_16714:1308-1937(-)